jgi:hypothetical protein
MKPCSSDIILVQDVAVKPLAISGYYAAESELNPTNK